MTCSCGHEFCWYCLKDYKRTSTSRYKSHNQKDCLFLLMLKLIIVLSFAFSLALAYSGNEAFNKAISYSFKICLGILRAFAIDGAITIQLIVLNHTSNRRANVKRLGMFFLAMDLLALLVIYLIGDLHITLLILGISLMVAGAAGLLGIMVEYSVNTWFNYIR